MQPSDYIIETSGLSREFMGFFAVKDVDLKVKRGTIHALIGPNGAGKTTVFNLLTKTIRPSAGSITFNGDDITDLSPPQVARLGLIRSFQISHVFPHLTVFENIEIALQRKHGIDNQFWRSKGFLHPLHNEIERLLDEFQLFDVAEKQAVELPYGRKRIVEIATTLALDPELMLLDEPTQGMGHEDVGRIAALIKRIGVNRTILMVEHNLSVVADLSDVITVLQRGEVLVEGPYETVANDARVIEAYLGTADAA